MRKDEWPMLIRMKCLCRIVKASLYWIITFSPSSFRSDETFISKAMLFPFHLLLSFITLAVFGITSATWTCVCSMLKINAHENQLQTSDFDKRIIKAEKLYGITRSMNRHFFLYYNDIQNSNISAKNLDEGAENSKEKTKKVTNNPLSNSDATSSDGKNLTSACNISKVEFSIDASAASNAFVNVLSTNESVINEQETNAISKPSQKDKSPRSWKSLNEIINNVIEKEFQKNEEDNTEIKVGEGSGQKKIEAGMSVQKEIPSNNSWQSLIESVIDDEYDNLEVGLAEVEVILEESNSPSRKEEESTCLSASLSCGLITIDGDSHSDGDNRPGKSYSVANEKVKKRTKRVTFADLDDVCDKDDSYQDDDIDNNDDDDEECVFNPLNQPDPELYHPSNLPPSIVVELLSNELKIYEQDGVYLIEASHSFTNEIEESCESIMSDEQKCRRLRLESAEEHENECDQEPTSCLISTEQQIEKGNNRELENDMLNNEKQQHEIICSIDLKHLSTRQLNEIIGKKSCTSTKQDLSMSQEEDKTMQSTISLPSFESEATIRSHKSPSNDDSIGSKTSMNPQLISDQPELVIESDLSRDLEPKETPVTAQSQESSSSANTRVKRNKTSPSVIRLKETSAEKFMRTIFDKYMIYEYETSDTTQDTSPGTSGDTKNSTQSATTQEILTVTENYKVNEETSACNDTSISGVNFQFGNDGTADMTLESTSSCSHREVRTFQGDETVKVDQDNKPKVPASTSWKSSKDRKRKKASQKRKRSK